ncbi:MAG: hypothetical protein Q7V04_10980 [Deltaproteobacteria bacterium]|nr:hypothetical protein [Deltaproteobacteria bacterium]
MKKLLLVVLAICTSATPVLAARTVYLKEGGTISARSVWRAKGKVHVLVNRDTLTEFSLSEIDLKRTFARKHRAVRKHHRVSGAVLATKASPSPVAATQTSGIAKPGLKLPSMPNLPKLSEKEPGTQAPNGEEGTIRKHKKEMSERAGE